MTSCKDTTTGSCVGAQCFQRTDSSVAPSWCDDDFIMSATIRGTGSLDGAGAQTWRDVLSYDSNWDCIFKTDNGELVLAGIILGALLFVAFVVYLFGCRDFRRVCCPCCPPPDGGSEGAVSPDGGSEGAVSPSLPGPNPLKKFTATGVPYVASSTAESDMATVYSAQSEWPSAESDGGGGGGGDDPLEKIKRLGKMKEEGILTQEEFDTKKAELLARI